MTESFAKGLCFVIDLGQRVCKCVKAEALFLIPIGVAEVQVTKFALNGG
jgi:hypothetical protein